jgi:hypothetical protein
MIRMTMMLTAAAIMLGAACSSDDSRSATQNRGQSRVNEDELMPCYQAGEKQGGTGACYECVADNAGSLIHQLLLACKADEVCSLPNGPGEPTCVSSTGPSLNEDELMPCYQAGEKQGGTGACYGCVADDAGKLIHQLLLACKADEVCSLPNGPGEPTCAPSR